MASIQERRNKGGKLISYSIRVHRGRSADGKQLKPFTATFEVSPTWTEKSARKKAEAFAATFEKECREGTASDSRQRFEEYCEYVLNLKEQRGDKHSTIIDYRDMTKRIYPEIGHIKLKDLQAHHLNALYAHLLQDGVNKHTGGKLSNKTVLRYHRLISIVCAQAVKEGIIPFSPAARAEPPKAEKKEVNYMQQSDLAAILNALEQEPIKWKTLVHLLLITGARRGEIIGLKWKYVDFDNNRLYICNSISYTPDKGVYESTPKTESSKRYVSLPADTMRLLKQYNVWQIEERFRLGTYYADQGFVFSQDNGNPMHPDSVTTWLARFSKRHSLPHINPHAFRHTMASLLYFNGVDSVSISKRLGHAQVSTTSDIYAHVIEEADKRNADILGDIFLKRA